MIKFQVFSCKQVKEKLSMETKIFHPLNRFSLHYPSNAIDIFPEMLRKVTARKKTSRIFSLIPIKRLPPTYLSIHINHNNYIFVSISLLPQIFRKYHVKYNYGTMSYRVSPTYIPDKPLKFQLIERDS